jgi:hypothetical protein
VQPDRRPSLHSTRGRQITLTIELHGQLASLRLPDPNWFGGELMIADKDQDWRTIRTDDKTFGVKNWPVAAPKFANNRGLGLADMARAIIDQRPHRANG